MAWTSPRTYVAGELITAAIGNQQWRDNSIAMYAGAISLASQAAGDILYASSASQLARVGIGAAGTVLVSNGSAPAWSASPTITFADGTAGAPSITFASDPDTGFYRIGANDMAASVGTGLLTRWNAGVFTVYGTVVANAISLNQASQDTILTRDAANTPAFRNGANAQTLRVYTSYTDASNYEYGSLAATAGAFTISAGTLGTGSDNIDIVFTPIGTGTARSTAGLADSVGSLATVRAGGIGIASQAALDFVYASSSTQLARLAVGTALKVPRVNAAANAYEFWLPRADTYACTLTDVVNTSDETTALSFDIPANTMAAGDVIEVWWAWLGKNNAGSTSPTVTVKVNVGAGAQATIWSVAWADTADEIKKATLLCYITRVGNDCWIASNPTYDISTKVTNITVSTPTNFTAANTVSVKVTLASASAALYLKPQAALARHHKYAA